MKLALWQTKNRGNLRLWRTFGPTGTLTGVTIPNAKILNPEMIGLDVNKNKWKWAFVAICSMLYAAYLWDDYKEPSDSGKMSWFTFLLVKYKADRGDGEALAHLSDYYEMDDSQKHAEKISELLFSSVTLGYGGKKLGRERITMSFIENCANLGPEGPEQTAKLFALVRERGGGLTPYGHDVEARWLSGEFPDCAPFAPRQP